MYEYRKDDMRVIVIEDHRVTVMNANTCSIGITKDVSPHKEATIQLETVTVQSYERPVDELPEKWSDK